MYFFFVVWQSHRLTWQNGMLETILNGLTNVQGFSSTPLTKYLAQQITVLQILCLFE